VQARIVMMATAHHHVLHESEVPVG